MAKIKNWSKTGKNYYRNDETNTMLQIGIIPDDGRYGIFVYPEKGKSQRIGYYDRYNNKESARKEAIKYMREHPNG